MTRDDFAALDARDPLAPLRACFDLPGGLIYLDGNSLGPMSHAVRDRLVAAGDRWAQRLIAGWTEEGWMEAPTRLGDRLAPLIGAGPGEVLVTDSTTVNLFKLLQVALQLRPDRRAVVIEREDFPTDRYLVRSVAAAARREVRHADPERLGEGVDQDVAVVALSHVNYRTGRMLDMASITAAAHQAGALVLWDLCHSAGAVPVDLDGCDADLAAGCTYKFLNGGPGAPAFLHVAGRLQDAVLSPIPGWFGHDDPFAFADAYAPAGGIRRFLAGTPGVLGMAALEGALEVWDRVDMAAARRKSVAMGDQVIRLVDERCRGTGVEVVSPRDPGRRGSQVSLRHPQAMELSRRLAAEGVLPDFRPPDIVRFGLTPLYTRFIDLWDAVEVLCDLLGGL